MSSAWHRNTLRPGLHCRAGTGWVCNFHLTGEFPCVLKYSELLHSSQDIFVNCLGERITFLIKAHLVDPRAKTSSLLLGPAVQIEPHRAASHKMCCYKEKGLDIVNNCQRYGDSVPAFCTEIICLCHICEHPSAEAKELINLKTYQPSEFAFTTASVWHAHAICWNIIRPCKPQALLKYFFPLTFPPPSLYRLCKTFY